MDFSVGDFAENLIAQEKGKGGIKPPTFTPDPSVYSADVGAQAPDISDVQVPNDFVSHLVEGKTPEVPIESPSPQPVAEDTELRSLIQELKDVISEVRQTLTEMTAVGSLGAGSSAPQKKKEEEDEDPVEALLKKVRGKRAKR